MLKRNGGAYPVSGGAEDDERLVPADLDESAARAIDDVLDDLGEGGSEASGSLVAVLLGVPRVATDVRDQEVRIPASEVGGRGSSRFKAATPGR